MQQPRRAPPAAELEIFRQKAHMRKRTVIIAGSLVLILVVCVVAWTTTRHPAPLKVSVLFTGYTNDASGARLAVFQVRNESEIRMRRWGVYHVEVRGDVQRRGPLFFGRNAFVEPGQSTVFALPAYTNQVAWRAALHCSRDGWQRSFSDFVGGLPPSINQLVPRKLQGERVELVWSDWIER
jgi:hypothetical protein